MKCGHQKAHLPHAENLCRCVMFGAGKCRTIRAIIRAFDLSVSSGSAKCQGSNASWGLFICTGSQLGSRSCPAIVLLTGGLAAVFSLSELKGESRRNSQTLGLCSEACLVANN